MVVPKNVIVHIKVIKGHVLNQFWEEIKLIDLLTDISALYMGVIAWHIMNVSTILYSDGNNTRPVSEKYW